MDPRSKRRWTYVATAIIGAIIIIAAIILLQQPIQNKTTPPASKTPPVVTTGAASGVSTTAATLQGSLALLGSASTVSVGFLWGTSPSLAGATNTTGTSQSAAGGFNQALSGLSAGTAYYFQTWALGDGFATGAVVSFTTLTPSNPQSNPPSVATKGATGIGNASATLNGDLGALGTASSVTVGFVYSTSPSLAGAVNASAGGQTSAGAFDAAVSGLASNTTYYVQAWALGDGFANGSVVSFKTAPKTPGSGNGHHVPPGWAHAACPDVPEKAPAHGVRARCLYNETYGQMKKEQGNVPSALPTSSPRDTQIRTADSGKSGNHRSSHSWA